MRTILLKLSAILLIALVPAMVMNGIMSVKKDAIGFQYAYLDKIKIINQHPEKKIVLTGGSNAVFGINSSLLQDSLGEKVVNMSLHGELGLRFPLETAKSFLKPGDVLIIFPEYDNFRDEFWLGENYLSNVVATDYKYFVPFLNRSQDYLCVKNFFRTSFKNFSNEYTSRYDLSAYRRTEFDSLGDYIGHLNKPSKAYFPVSHLDTAAFNNDVITYLNTLTADWKKQNISVYIVFPSLLKEGYTPKKVFIDYLLKKIAQYPNIQVVGTPVEYTFDHDQLFDTEYHLNKVGREERTKLLIKDLKPLLTSVGTK